MSSTSDIPLFASGSDPELRPETLASSKKESTEEKSSFLNSYPQSSQDYSQAYLQEGATLTPSQHSEWFDLALLSPSARRSLTTLAQGTPPILIALVSDLETLAASAASLLAGRWVANTEFPDAILSDLRVISPTSDRWTAEELRSEILDVVSRTPVIRHVIVIDSADRMDQRLADRLLRTLEEPPSPASFVLCVEDVTQLPVTIQGRLEHIVEILPASPTERAEALVTAGVARPAAETAVRLAGRAVTLAPLLATNPEIASLASRLLDHPAWDSTTQPITDADEIVFLATRLAVSWEQGELAERGTEHLTPATKARLRSVIRMGFERHRSASRALLRRTAAQLHNPIFAEISAPRGRERTSMVNPITRRLDALTLAEQQLRAFTAPKIVLAALLAADATFDDVKK